MAIRNILAAFMLFCNSTSLSAQAAIINGNQYYIQLNGGFARGLSPKSDVFLNQTMKTSAIYGAELGYKITNHFAVSLSLDHRPGFFNKVTSIVYANGIPIYEKTNIKVKSMVSMLNLYVSTELNEIKPYLTAGIGASVNRTSNTSSSYLPYSGNQSLLLHLNFSGQGRTNLAFKVGAGVKVPINDHMDFDIRYQFTNLNKFRTGNHCQSKLIENQNTTTDIVASSSAKLRTHEVILGISYKF